VWQSF